MNNKKVIVALDGNNIIKIKNIVVKCKSEAFAFKIGYEFFFNYGIEGYKQIKKICPNIFLDLKLHDIPNSVKQGIKAIDKLRPLLTTVHISGGDEMMRASLQERKYTKILGVSILTSLNEVQTKKYYNKNKIETLVKSFVKNAEKLKLDGVVCSPKEVKIIRNLVSKNFLIVTPGIRMQSINKAKDDQKRTMSAKKAIDLGANYLVIGRPITKSKDPLKTLKEINDTILK